MSISVDLSQIREAAKLTSTWNLVRLGIDAPVNADVRTTSAGIQTNGQTHGAMAMIWLRNLGCRDVELEMSGGRTWSSFFPGISLSVWCERSIGTRFRVLPAHILCLTDITLSQKPLRM